MQEHVQVDSSKCKACRRCEFACIASHHGIDIKTAMKMKDTYSPRCWAVKGDGFKTSVRCHFCNPAPCCNICPTGALEQHKDGSISVNLALCAGCMMCMQVCPYGVIQKEMIKQDTVPDTQSATDKTGIAARCDLCHDWRIEKGVEYTACMEACAARALILVKSDGTIVSAPPIEKKAPPKPKPVEEAKPDVVLEEPKLEPVKEVVLEEPKIETKPEPKPEPKAAEPVEPKKEPEAQQAESEQSKAKETPRPAKTYVSSQDQNDPDKKKKWKKKK